MKPEKIARFLEISLDKVLSHLYISSDEITTIPEAKKAFRKASSNSESQRLAMEKWLSLCTIAEEVMEAFRVAPDNSESQRLAIEKLLSFCITAEQLKKAFWLTPTNSVSEKLVIRKFGKIPDEE